MHIVVNNGYKASLKDNMLELYPVDSIKGDSEIKQLFTFFINQKYK